MRSRRGRDGISPLRAGAITLAVILVVTYLGFAKDLPFLGQRFELKATFTSANSIRLNSPVRIAGVDVGKVTAVEHEGNAATVTMEIEEGGLPIHRDAELKIRPRMFLEGNFFVDVHPGSPSEPALDDGETVPVTQTAVPVQLDQVLTALQSDARADLQVVLDEFANGLTAQPTAAQDAASDPAVRGESAVKAVGDSYADAGPALRGAALVQEGLAGIQPHDLSELVAALGRIAGSLESREQALGELVTNFNLTTGALAAEQSALRQSVRLLAPTVAAANRAFESINAALPSASAFARDVLPGVEELPDTIAAAFPWMEQTQLLLGPDELRGVVRRLQPAMRDLSGLVDESLVLLPQLDLVNRCVKDIVLPTGDVKLQDGPLTVNVENYKEFWYTMAALAGESQSHDGNGSMVRLSVGGGSQTVSTGASSFSGDQLFGNATSKPLGTRPRYPGRRPPYNSQKACYTNQLPDLNGPAANGGAADRVVSSSAAPRAAARTRPAGTQAGQRSLMRDLTSLLNPFRRQEGGR